MKDRKISRKIENELFDKRPNIIYFSDNIEERMYLNRTEPYYPYDEDMDEEEQAAFTGATVVYAVCTGIIAAIIVIILYITQP